MTTLEDILAGLPAERRAKIEKQTQELIREEKVRRSAVSRRPLTKLGVVSEPGLTRQLERLASRADMSLGALRRQVATMGGKLRVVVEIEGRPPVELKRLGAGKEPARIALVSTKQ